MLGPMEPLLKQLEELLANQARVLATLEEARSEPLNTTEQEAFAQLTSYQSDAEEGRTAFLWCRRLMPSAAEVKRIQAQMRSITRRSEDLKAKAAKLEGRKRAALEEEQRKVGCSCAVVSMT